MIAIGTDRFRSRAAASPELGAGSGGGVDDIFKRLGAVESAASEIRAEVRGIAAALPYLATKAEMNAMEVRLVKWMVGTVLSGMALAAAVAQVLSRFH